MPQAELQAADEALQRCREAQARCEDASTQFCMTADVIDVIIQPSTF